MAKEVTGLQLKGEIETEPIDITQYIGKKTKIATYKVMENTIDGKESYYLQVRTEAVGEHEGEPLTASKNFGLKFDKKEGGVGWSSQGKLAKFLKQLGVSDYTQLVGQEVIVMATEPDSNGQRWLTFS